MFFHYFFKKKCTSLELRNVKSLKLGRILFWLWSIEITVLSSRAALAGPNGHAV